MTNDLTMTNTVIESLVSHSSISKRPGRQYLSPLWPARRYASKCRWHRRRSPPP